MKQLQVLQTDACHCPLIPQHIISSVLHWMRVVGYAKPDSMLPWLHNLKGL